MDKPVRNDTMDSLWASIRSTAQEIGEERNAPGASVDHPQVAQARTALLHLAGAVATPPDAPQWVLCSDVAEPLELGVYAVAVITPLGNTYVHGSAAMPDLGGMPLLAPLLPAGDHMYAWCGPWVLPAPPDPRVRRGTDT